MNTTNKKPRKPKAQKAPKATNAAKKGALSAASLAIEPSALAQDVGADEQSPSVFVEVTEVAAFSVAPTAAEASVPAEQVAAPVAAAESVAEQAAEPAVVIQPAAVESVKVVAPKAKRKKKGAKAATAEAPAVPAVAEQVSSPEVDEASNNQAIEAAPQATAQGADLPKASEPAVLQSVEPQEPSKSAEPKSWADSTEPLIQIETKRIAADAGEVAPTEKDSSASDLSDFTQDGLRDHEEIAQIIYPQESESEWNERLAEIDRANQANQVSRSTQDIEDDQPDYVNESSSQDFSASRAIEREDAEAAKSLGLPAESDASGAQTQPAKVLEPRNFYKLPFVLPMFVLMSMGSIWAAVQSGAEWAQTIEIALITLVTASIASTVGFAFPAMASVGFSATGMDVEQMVRYLSLGSVTTQLYSIFIFRHSVPWKQVRPVVLSGLVMAPLGVIALRSFDPNTYLIALGIVITLYAFYMLRRKSITAHFNATKKTDVVAGAIAGTVGGFAALPITCLAIYSQLKTDGSDPIGQRAFYQTSGLIIQIYVLTLLVFSDIGRESTKGINFEMHDLFIIPVVLLATQMGLSFLKRMQSATLTKIVNVMLLVSGVSIIAKQLIG